MSDSVIRVINTKYAYKVASTNVAAGKPPRVIRSGFSNRDSARWFLSTVGGRAKGYVILQEKTEVKEIR